MLNSENAINILNDISNDNDINVKLIEWNFTYWYKPPNYTIHSIAQLTAITDMLYKSKYLFEYVFFNDLDEYLFFDNNESYENIFQLISKYEEYDCIKFNMFWSHYINDTVVFNDEHNIKTISYENFNNNFNINNFTKDENVTNDDWRTKCIIKTNSNYYYLVHRPCTTYYCKKNNSIELVKLNLTEKRLDGFFHLMNITEKIRVVKK